MNRGGGLEDTLDLAHGALDVDGLDVLPVLLEERHEEVDGQVDVDEQLGFGHLDVADGDAEAESLLELELDGALDFVELLKNVFVGAEQRGELAGLGEGVNNARKEKGRARQHVLEPRGGRRAQMRGLLPC